MKSKRWEQARSVALAVISAVGVTLFGFSGVGQAATLNGTIQNTGPGSTNEIVFENEFTCEVDNDTNINLDNNTVQNASTGDATVEGNTTVSGWGAWDPVVWQNQGHSYAQWQSAFAAYLAENQADWQAKWGNLRGSGGATTGDASNSNEVEVNIAVTNGGCLSDSTEGTSEPTQPGSSETPGGVLGATSGAAGGSGGIASLLGSLFGGSQSGAGTGSHVGPHGNIGEGSATPSDPDSPSGGFGCSGAISTTGPNSNNSISCGNDVEVDIKNDTNINIRSDSGQNANSGDATTSGNTGSGGSSSGDAGNTSSTSIGTATQN